MLHELRTYDAAPGKAARLEERFRRHVFALFRKHQIPLVWFARHVDDPERFSYLSAFPDEASRQARWAAFAADPVWQAVKAESETDGPLTAAISTQVLCLEEVSAAEST